MEGRLPAAAALFRRAQRLWAAGADPDEVLDPGRLFDLEASLCRDQRRFEDALALLERARKVTRSLGHNLINMACTLRTMGDREGAIAALLEAQVLPQVQEDSRLRNILHCNLGFELTEVGRLADAAELARQVHDLADEMGDEIGLLRALWLDGRIAAGSGRIGEALALLARARQGFAENGMWYDEALALLEEAGLLLDQGRTAEVKALARDLVPVFGSVDVHREALAALRLFQEAADQEAATSDLTRRVLRYLFRSRYDQGQPFEKEAG